MIELLILCVVVLLPAAISMYLKHRIDQTILKKNDYYDDLDDHDSGC